MKIVLVSHSSRPFFEARCQINELNKRFEKDRTVDSSFSVDQLKSVEESVPFNGALSIWAYQSDTKDLRFISTYEPNFKIQSACVLNDKIVVLGADRLQVLSFELDLINEITEDYVIGGHTVTPLDDSCVLFTSAPANKIYVYDVEAQELKETICLPAHLSKSLIGELDISLRENYIPTDLQQTHINAAFNGPKGILATFWIQGALYVYQDHSWRELTTGFRGSHGGRWIDGEQVMMTDSPAGLIWFFDADSGKVLRRIDLASKWVHDAEKVAPGVIIALFGDRNTIEIVDENTGQPLSSVDAAPFGETVMFLSCFDVDEELVNKIPTEEIPQVKEAFTLSEYGDNLVEGIVDNGGLYPIYHSSFSNIEIQSRSSVRYDILSTSRSLILEAGEYVFSSDVVCHLGGVSIGIFDNRVEAWISQLVFDSVVDKAHTQFKLDQATEVQLMVSAHNPGADQHVKAVVKDIALRRWRNSTPNLIPSFLDSSALTISNERLTHQLRLNSVNPLANEYLIETKEVILEPGKYLFSVNVKCFAGAISAGIAISGGGWLCQLLFDKQTSENSEIIEVTETSAVHIAIAANNPLVRNIVDAYVEHIGLYKIES